MFLDTSFCIDLMREHNQGVDGPALRKLNDLGNMPLSVSVFVLCELQAGARLAQRPRKELKRVECFATMVDIVYPGPTFAVAYGECEAFLRKKGRPIPVMDLLIGLTAKGHGLPLLTRDPTHFSLIPGLVVEAY
jgi:predicted nucleic acid-binding protein